MSYLSRGSHGEEVKFLQKDLSKLGLYDGKLDGDYGPKTQASVLEFQRRYMVDGITNEITRDGIDKAVIAWGDLPAGCFLNAPTGLAEVAARYGEIKYKDVDNGKIVVTNFWEQNHLVTYNFPIVGDLLVNHAIVEPLERVLSVIEDRGLDRLIQQFWCYVPRHKMWNKRRGLSMHAYGCAVDINWSENRVGAKGNMDPGIISTFEYYGWTWGGRWRIRDDMHFQFANEV